MALISSVFPQDRKRTYILQQYNSCERRSESCSKDPRTVSYIKCCSTGNNHPQSLRHRGQERIACAFSNNISGAPPSSACVCCWLEMLFSCACYYFSPLFSYLANTRTSSSQTYRQGAGVCLFQIQITTDWILGLLFQSNETTTTKNRSVVQNAAFSFRFFFSFFFFADLVNERRLNFALGGGSAYTQTG